MHFATLLLLISYSQAAFLCFDKFAKVEEAHGPSDMMADTQQTIAPPTSNPENSTSNPDVTPPISQSAPVDSRNETSQTDTNPENVATVNNAEPEVPWRDEKDPNLGEIYESDALLYCRKKGYRHSILLEFGLRRCPACHEDLVPKIRKVNADGSVDEEPPTAGTGDVAFEVEYTDSGGNWFGRENWSKPFNLQEARKGVAVHDQTSILRVVSVLRTSFPADENRYSHSQKTLMDQGILNNPTVSVYVHSTKLIVYSQRFLEVLRKFIGYYPGINIEAQSVTIEEPYCVIAHHLKELNAFQEAHRPLGEAIISADTKVENTKSEGETDDEATYHHIDTVMKFVKSPTWEESIEMEEARYSRNPPMCTYRMLWLLYKPGDTVYTESDGKPAASVIQSVKVDPAVLAVQPDKLSPYKITIWYLDFDGRHVRRWSRVITIAPFDGEKEVYNLSVVPCRLFDQSDSGQRRRTLESEGERWYRFLGPKQVRYAGDTMDIPRRRVSGFTLIGAAGNYINPGILTVVG